MTIDASAGDPGDAGAPRAVVLRRIAAELRRARSACGHTLRVAVDGPDAAGKTTLADELAQALTDGDVLALRVRADDFHHPVEIRSRRGALSAEGYYLDAFDHATLVDRVLIPLGPGGTGEYLPAAFDLTADRSLDADPAMAPPEGILLLDGVFLLRPELRDHWDVTVYLQVEPEETLRRALIRDLDRFGSPEAVRRRYRTRYLPAQSMYRMVARPRERADIVLDMADPAAPVVLRGLD